MVIPTMRRKENVVRGPAPVRFQQKEGGSACFECQVLSWTEAARTRLFRRDSPPARRRRARAWSGGGDERSRSEATTATTEGAERRDAAAGIDDPGTEAGAGGRLLEAQLGEGGGSAAETDRHALVVGNHRQAVLPTSLAQ